MERHQNESGIIKDIAFSVYNQKKKKTETKIKTCNTFNLSTVDAAECNHW